MIICDMMFYNSYTDIYTILVIQTEFKPNGMVDTTNQLYMNIKGEYYNFSKTPIILRCICEIIFVVILCLYVSQEVN